MIDASRIARRDALALIGGGAAMAAALGGAAPALAGTTRAPLDLDNPADRLKAYMLMRGALDDRLVIGCVAAQYFGVVDDAMLPLCGVVSATFSRYRPRPSGGYDGVALEVAYFTDAITGKVIAELRNPYTNETVAVPPGGYPPAPFAILPDLSVKLGRERPGMTMDTRVLAIQASGDDIWLPELIRTEASMPGAAKPFRYSELVTLHTRRSELEAPGIKRVRCETAFANVVGWRPWLKMGDRPGHMMAIGSGRYGATLDDLPPAWIEAARAQRPELLTDPAALLDPIWKAER